MNRIITLFLSAALLSCFTSFKTLDDNHDTNTATDVTVDDCIDDNTKFTSPSTTTELPSGSIIIDMGETSQSFNNGLKPYGLIYALIKEHSTPIFWSINPNKAKDGIDFTVDGKSFKGGPFAVRAEYLTAAVIAKINNWKSQGVVTYKTSSDVTIPIYKELTFFPTWVLDKKNGKIAEKYLKNAGIPSSAYTTALPETLDECHDLFVLPHAEPTWKDHGYLLKWNSAISEGGNQGYIWSGCTAASNLENLYNPSTPSEQMNFLSLKTQNALKNAQKKGPGKNDNYFENALVLADNHEDASNTRHNIDFHSDPFMQFIGQSDGVHKGGKEEIYLPVNGGGWRPSTKVGLWDTNQKDLGKLSPGKAALMLYGPAFGDTNRGQVMYQAGHDLNKDGSTQERVAAQRGFLNFSFDAAAAKVPQIVMNNPEQREVTLTNGESITFDVTGIPILGGGITYEWSSTCAIGSFDNTSSATPVFTIPNTPIIVSNQSCIVTVKAMDECGRIAFLTYKINFIVKPINCDITAITATNSSVCNDNGTSTSSDDFFTTDITVTFSTPPTIGLLFLSGDAGATVPVDQLDSDTSHTFIDVQIPANGSQVSLTAFFQKDVEEEEIACTFSNPVVMIAPESCSITPCSITAISTANSSSCNDNGTNDVNDDFFTTDITVTFSNPPTTGLLFLTGNGGATIPVDQLDSDTSHTFIGVQIPANGSQVSLTAFFQKDVEEEEIACTFSNSAVMIAPESCSITPCSITAISAANSSSCNDNGTNDVNDDFFTTDITVTFSNPPTTGLLFLSGDAGATIPVDQLDSDTSHTFIGVQIPANGSQVSLTAFFQKDVEEEEIACTFSNSAVMIAPESCSITPCSITAISAANSSSCNDNGTNDVNDDFFTADITVKFSNPPTTGLLFLTGDGGATISVDQLDSDTSHTFIGVQFPSDGNQVSLTTFFQKDVEEEEIACTFSNPVVMVAPESCSYTPCNITAVTASNNTSCNDNGTNTPNDDFFTADITVSFTSPPPTGLLLLTGNLIASVKVNINGLDSDTSHTFTNVQLPTNGGPIDVKAAFFLNEETEEAECTFNGTSVVTAPLSCSYTPCNITTIYASNNSSCDDNGTDTLNDNFFTADITVLFTSPPATGFLLLTGDLITSVKVDVSGLDNDASHTFTDVQLPADGGQIDVTAYFVLDEEEEEAECTFNNSSVIIAPLCCAVIDESCNISAITATNSSSCNNNETAISSDDFFTADITVSFTSIPATGVLKLTGDGTTSVTVSELDNNTSHTFIGVQFPADGNSIDLTALFTETEGIECAFNNTNVMTAPTSCSFNPCAISSISAANTTSCNDNGTSTSTDDFFTSDITVTFSSVPSTGVLKLTGDGTISVNVSELNSDTSHTFIGVKLPADGGLIDLTALFTGTEGIECAFNDTEVMTAPSSCSEAPCNISSITASNITCNESDSKINFEDSFFTADITITFTSAPTTGFLEVATDNSDNLRVSVSQLNSDTSHTFTGVELLANNKPINLTAFFITENQESSCNFSDSIEVSCDESDTSVNDKIDFKDLSIYPNPSKGNITIDTPNVSGEVRVNVVDLTGKLIMKKNIDPKRKNIELYNLPQGVFLVKLNSRSKNIIRKIIVE